MKTSRETLADIISSARDYEMVSKALSSVIDLLIDENFFFKNCYWINTTVAIL